MPGLTEILPGIQSTLFVAARIAPILVLSPILNSFRIPGSVRLIALLALSFALSQNPSRQTLPSTYSDGHLIAILATEVVTGTILALGVHATFAAFSVAGRVIDIQSGLAIASVIDPVTKTSAGTISQILSISALTFFLYSDIHLDLVRALDFSFDIVPVGIIIDTESLPVLAARGTLIFSYAAAIAAPVLGALLLIDIAISITSRTMPQINVLVLATPIKIAVAIALLSISCRFWTDGTTSPLRLFESFLPA